jgi:peptide/nickel transport system permease protein
MRALAKGILADKYALFGVLVMTFLVVIALAAPAIIPYEVDEIVRDESGQVKVWLPPSRDHLFGTTSLGRDILSQVIYGTRTALLVGLGTALIATVIGFSLGLIAGHLRGIYNTAISRIVEISFSIPFEAFAIVVLTLLSPNTWTLILVMCLVFWRMPTRGVRNLAMTMSDSNFIKAARIAGASRWWVMTRHLVPLVLPLAFVFVPIVFGNAMLAEASLSFLGFGDPESTSWGEILREGFEQGAMYSGMWWIIFPGLAITIATASMFLITRPFEELLDPRLQRG